MSLLYKDIDPELLGYGSNNNNKPLPSKDQQKLANAVATNAAANSSGAGVMDTAPTTASFTFFDY
jgi:hypothetical protein